MLASPTPVEWLAIYAPLTVILVVSTTIELKTQRIPNGLVLVAFVYLLAARSVVGPLAAWQYLVSLLIGIVIGMGIGWAPGFIGGGAAKLLVAVSAGLAPWQAVSVTSAAVLFGRILRAARKDQDEKTYVPGSIVIFVFTAMVLAASCLQVKHP